MFCRSCGAQLPEDAPFCGACGTHRQMSSSPRAEEVGNKRLIAHPRRSAGRRRWRWIAVVLVVVGAAGGLGAYFTTTWNRHATLSDQAFAVQATTTCSAAEASLARAQSAVPATASQQQKAVTLGKGVSAVQALLSRLVALPYPQGAQPQAQRADGEANSLLAALTETQSELRGGHLSSAESVLRSGRVSLLAQDVHRFLSLSGVSACE